MPTTYSVSGTLNAHSGSVSHLSIDAFDNAGQPDNVFDRNTRVTSVQAGAYQWMSLANLLTVDPSSKVATMPVRLSDPCVTLGGGEMAFNRFTSLTVVIDNPDETIDDGEVVVVLDGGGGPPLLMVCSS